MADAEVGGEGAQAPSPGLAPNGRLLLRAELALARRGVRGAAQGTRRATLRCRREHHRAGWQDASAEATPAGFALAVAEALP